MNRSRDFAISAASLAGLSLSAGCSLGGGNIDGTWAGASYTDGGQQFTLPFSFSGELDYSQPPYYYYTISIDSYAMNFGLSVVKGVATLTRSFEMTYSYYWYYSGWGAFEGGSSYAVDATYTGNAVRVDDRTFDIVMPVTTKSVEVDGEPVEDDTAPEMTKDAFVLSCSADGEQLLCEDQAGGVLLFNKA